MALSTQYKVNQLAKDLEIKTKDIVELMAGAGVEVKTQKTLQPEEFDIFLNLVTKANQIDNIDEYLDGVTYIPSKVKKVEPKAEPEVKEEAPKTEEKPEVKEEAPKAEQKPEVKVEAPKTEQKPEVKVEAPKAEQRPAAKVEAPKAEAKPAPAPRAEQKPAPRAEQRPEQKPAYGKQDQRPARPDQRPDQRFDRRPEQGNFNRPQNGGYNNNYNNNQRPQQGAQGGQQQRPFRDKDEMGSQRAPREKFQPKAIVREQTPKGTVVTKKHGETRVVDTRGTTVDLSKYDERLDNFVPDSVRDDRGGNQRVKKQQGGSNRAPVQKDVGGNRAPGSVKNNKNNKKAAPMPVKKQQLHIQVPDEITVGELASRLQAKAGDIVKKLMMMGVMASVNQSIDYDTAYLIADEMGAICEREVIVTIEDKLFEEKEDSADELIERAPVVCVMGHVDHGKTSLLDAIRNTHVTSGEAGGITQHIGAYRVSLGDKEITFLDTPGHEAFTAMRARGAMATDIAILVVAADDGIMPQTVEAINHAKQAGVQIIVAINKMDKPTANPDAIKQELTKYDLVPEEWGGDVMCVPVSALTHYGIDDLLERVLLIAEVEEYKANPNRRAKGIVIESKLDRGRGPVATVLVQNGTLHNGDIVIAGTAVGRVRSMADHTGRLKNAAGPSVPVEITGLADVPEAGDEIIAVENERMARELADQRKAKAKEAEFKANSRANLNDLFAQIAEGVKDLNVIVKADVAGSVEAVKQSLEKISNEEVKVKVIHAAAGAINEGDVTFAAASNAIIVGFNVRPDKTAIDSAERQNVEIRTYRVIYECIEEITAAMKGMLAPKFREAINGHAEVRQTIHVPNVGTIAGSYVQDGKIGRNNQIRVLRDGVVIFEDKISSLRRFKDDVKEVAQGYECGIGLEKFNDIKIGDILEAYFMEEIEQ
ncbi:MAG: translation initiation factor IF-2 [Clostridia bacterium]|nr:translation initiation factor IF-2 [Clostridia bacterium]